MVASWLFLWESWSVKRWLWYCKLIQLEPKRNVNCILQYMQIVFSVLPLVFHILIIFCKVKNVFLCYDTLYFVGCKYCFARLLVPPFFSSLVLLQGGGILFTSLREQFSAICKWSSAAKRNTFQIATKYLFSPWCRWLQEICLGTLLQSEMLNRWKCNFFSPTFWEWSHPF